MRGGGGVKILIFRVTLLSDSPHGVKSRELMTSFIKKATPMTSSLKIETLMTSYLKIATPMTSLLKVQTLITSSSHFFQTNRFITSVQLKNRSGASCQNYSMVRTLEVHTKQRAPHSGISSTRKEIAGSQQLRQTGTLQSQSNFSLFLFCLWRGEFEAEFNFFFL